MICKNLYFQACISTLSPSFYQSIDRSWHHLIQCLLLNLVVPGLHLGFLTGDIIAWFFLVPLDEDSISCCVFKPTSKHERSDTKSFDRHVFADIFHGIILLLYSGGCCITNGSKLLFSSVRNTTFNFLLIRFNTSYRHLIDWISRSTHTKLLNNRALSGHTRLGRLIKWGFFHTRCSYTSKIRRLGERRAWCPNSMRQGKSVAKSPSDGLFVMPRIFTINYILLEWSKHLSIDRIHWLPFLSGMVQWIQKTLLY